MGKKQFRICTVCRKNLSLDNKNFHPVKLKKFKYFTYTCRDCHKQNCRNRRISYSKYFKEYAKNHSAERLKSTQKWIKNNPEKTKAHKLVHKAIKQNKLVKKACAKCKNKNTDAHHPDYNKPLKVIWLCRLHHKELHRSIKNQSN